jgi:hypothetical protein
MCGAWPKADLEWPGPLARSINKTGTIQSSFVLLQQMSHMAVVSAPPLLGRDQRSIAQSTYTIFSNLN